MTKVQLDGADVDVAYVKDGKPVYIDDATNQEMAIDGGAAMDTITRLNGEAQSHRVKKEEAETKLALYADIDPVAAKTALETVANLDSGELLKAGKVDEIKQAAIQATETKYKNQLTVADATAKENLSTIAKLTNSLHGEKITNAFANSSFVKEKMAVPASMAQKLYGDRFKFEEDKIVAYDAQGNKVISLAKPGEMAGFDEAIENIVGGDPNRGAVMKGKGNTGGGGDGNQGGGGGGNNNNDKSVNRKTFDSWNPVAKAEFMRKGGSVSDE